MTERKRKIKRRKKRNDRKEEKKDWRIEQPFFFNIVNKVTKSYVDFIKVKLDLLIFFCQTINL